MADKRKLQGEIDRCLKKVSEGVEAFEDIWQKVQAATNANQKEKYEADLKKEIKKLQRLRDQIKTWAASNDIKDKRPLLENRKLIETQMERFKVVERETKTKAYSKEGLGQANKIDPAQKEKDECREWLNDSIDRLKIQIDQFESEIETFHAGTKKKKMDKDKADRIDELQERIAQHRFHIRKLEELHSKMPTSDLVTNEIQDAFGRQLGNPKPQEKTMFSFQFTKGVSEGNNRKAILRLLDNESVECDAVNKVREDVEYYIDNCEEPDFIDDEGLYDEFDLDSDLALSTEFVMQRSPLDANSKEDEDEIPSPGSSVNSSGFIGVPSSPSSKVSTASVEEDFKKNSPKKHTKSSSTSSTSSSNGTTSSSAPPVVTSTTSVSTTTVKPSKPIPVSSTNSTNSLISSTAITSAVPLSSAAPLINHVAVIKTNSGPPASKPVGPPPTTPYAVAAGASQILPSASKPNSQPVRIPSPPPSIPQSITTSTNVLSNHIDSSQYPALNSAGIREKKPNEDFSSILASQIAATSITTATLVINQSDAKPESSVPSSLPEAVSLTHTLPSSVSKSIVSSLSNGVTTSLPMAQSTSSALPPLKTIPGSQTTLDGPLQIPTDYTKTPNLFESSNSPVQGSKPSTPQTQEVHLQPLLGVAPLGPIQLTRERINQLNQLEASFHHLPQKQDSERMRPSLPRNAVPIAPYHHHQPPPHIDSLEFFQRLSTETLFFIFYYQEGTRAQYLAAKALKKQSWRFHTKYMMWFQRHEEPKNITDEYEQGTYIYFDFEKWSQRKREGFTFEYRFLEDKELS